MSGELPWLFFSGVDGFRTKKARGPTATERLEKRYIDDAPQHQSGAQSLRVLRLMEAPEAMQTKPNAAAGKQM